MRPIRLLEKGRWQDVDFVCNIYDVQSSKQEKLSAACGEWQLEERVSSLEVLKYPKRKGVPRGVNVPARRLAILTKAGF